ncbi:MAG: GNAT family N-acetyltransferase, partial [Cytophagales bacterium]|nr:GNAT family N-acetyltransferase [Cytophagales bacterium]
LENETLDFEQFKEIFTKNLVRTDWAYFNIVLNFKVIGFCSLHFKDSLHHSSEIAELEEFFIDPSQQNKGLGKKVVTELKTFCKNRGINQLEVSTNKKREAAYRFYLSSKFSDSHHKLVIKF